MIRCLTPPEKTWGGRWFPEGSFFVAIFVTADRKLLRKAPGFLTAIRYHALKPNTMKTKINTLLLILFFSYSCTAQKSPVSNSQIDGKWLVKLNSNDIGTVNTILEFETDENSFKAWTRKGADRDILGFWKSTLARVFTDDFKKGSLIRLTDGTISQEEDTLVLSGIFRSAVGSYYFNGQVLNGQLTAELKNNEKETRGTVTGSKNPEIGYPIDNYPEIVSEALDTAKSRIYNRDELETKEWKDFEKTIKKKSGKFKDDVELVFAFYYYASKLPFSHFNLVRIEEDTTREARANRSQNLFLEEKSPETALLTIESFGGTAGEVDSVFSVIIDKGYNNLIVDLRNNAGGTVEAGLTFASKVLDTTLIGGFFLTQKWFNDNEEIPGKDQLEEFPVFSEASYDLIIEGIHNKKGLLLKVKPSKPTFNGNLYIITNERTASTCEPIVHGLKAAGRATIVGKTTAGAMLNGERFDLKSGFSVFVPTADYYTVDGLRIDQNGVEPDIELKDEKPVEYILNQFIK